MTRRQPRVLRPDRVRNSRTTAFGWLDARLLRQGWLGRLGPQATATYAFLCLAADRQGVSYYRRARIAQALSLPEDQLERALCRLRELDLIAYAPFHPGAPDGFHQVLSLPESLPDPLPPDLSEALRRVGRPPTSERPRRS